MEDKLGMLLHFLDPKSCEEISKINVKRIFTIKCIKRKGWNVINNICSNDL